MCLVGICGWNQCLGKSGEATSAAFQAILERAAPRKPDCLFTDNGSEFRAEEFRRLCADHDIKQPACPHMWPPKPLRLQNASSAHIMATTLTKLREGIWKTLSGSTAEIG